MRTLRAERPVKDEFVIEAVPSVDVNAWANTALSRESIVRLPADKRAEPSVNILVLKIDKPVIELLTSDALPSVNITT